MKFSFLVHLKKGRRLKQRLFKHGLGTSDGFGDGVVLSFNTQARLSGSISDVIHQVMHWLSQNTQGLC